jgi:hypothetical protein
MERRDACHMCQAAPDYGTFRICRTDFRTDPHVLGTPGLVFREVVLHLKGRYISPTRLPQPEPDAGWAGRGLVMVIIAFRLVGSFAQSMSLYNGAHAQHVRSIKTRVVAHRWL